MADRKITVSVDIRAGGDLAAKVGEQRQQLQGLEHDVGRAQSRITALGAAATAMSRTPVATGIAHQVATRAAELRAVKNELAELAKKHGENVPMDELVGRLQQKHSRNFTREVVEGHLRQANIPIVPTERQPEVSRPEQPPQPARQPVDTPKTRQPEVSRPQPSAEPPQSAQPMREPAPLAAEPSRALPAAKSAPQQPQPPRLPEPEPISHRIVFREDDPGEFQRDRRPKPKRFSEMSAVEKLHLLDKEKQATISDRIEAGEARSLILMRKQLDVSQEQLLTEAAKEAIKAREIREWIDLDPRGRATHREIVEVKITGDRDKALAQAAQARIEREMIGTHGDEHQDMLIAKHAAAQEGRLKDVALGAASAVAARIQLQTPEGFDNHKRIIRDTFTERAERANTQRQQLLMDRQYVGSQEHLRAVREEIALRKEQQRSERSIGRVTSIAENGRVLTGMNTLLDKLGPIASFAGRASLIGMGAMGAMARANPITSHTIGQSVSNLFAEASISFTPQFRWMAQQLQDLQEKLQNMDPTAKRSFTNIATAAGVSAVGIWGLYKAGQAVRALWGTGAAITGGLSAAGQWAATHMGAGTVASGAAGALLGRALPVVGLGLAAAGLARHILPSQPQQPGQPFDSGFVESGIFRGFPNASPFSGRFWQLFMRGRTTPEEVYPTYGPNASIARPHRVLPDGTVVPTGPGQQQRPTPPLIGGLPPAHQVGIFELHDVIQQAALVGPLEAHTAGIQQRQLEAWIAATGTITASNAEIVRALEKLGWLAGPGAPQP